jgi:preprotein translocase subunit SecG
MGGGGGNFMSSRGTANVLTRATAILAGAFFFTSIVLALLATQARGPRSLLDRPATSAPATPTAPAAPASPAAPQVPQSGGGQGGTGMLEGLRGLSQPPAAPGAPAAPAPAAPRQ